MYKRIEQLQSQDINITIKKILQSTSNLRLQNDWKNCNSLIFNVHSLLLGYCLFLIIILFNLSLSFFFFYFCNILIVSPCTTLFLYIYIATDDGLCTNQNKFFSVVRICFSLDRSKRFSCRAES